MLSRLLICLSGVIFLLTISIISVVDVEAVTLPEHKTTTIYPKLPTHIRMSVSDEDKATVREYYYFLYRLKTYQVINLLKAHDIGMEDDLGLILTSIVWKESGFGTHLSNTKDGEHGSFGVAQILLDTAIKRCKPKTKEEIDTLKVRLLEDADFNLTQAVTELKFWLKSHSKLKEESVEKYYRHVIASYNNGYNSYNNNKGKKYADDVILRMKALNLFYRQKDKKVNKVFDGEIELIGHYYR